MAFRTLDDLGDIKGKRALVRVDLNVPMADGRVTDDMRLRALLPTVLELSNKGAKVLLLAHFGRPKGAKHSEMSVSMVLDTLQEVVGREIMFVPEIAGDVVRQSVGILADGDIALLENTRFWPGEEKNDPELAKAVAENGDFYVNDAFSAAHRAHAIELGRHRNRRAEHEVDVTARRGVDRDLGRGLFRSEVEVAPRAHGADAL